MKEKAAVGADIYVEDSVENVELLRRAENVPTIVFTNSMNEHLPGPRADTWSQVVDLTLAYKEKWERCKATAQRTLTDGQRSNTLAGIVASVASRRGEKEIPAGYVIEDRPCQGADEDGNADRLRRETR